MRKLNYQLDSASAAKVADGMKAVIAAVNRCATQKRGRRNLADGLSILFFSIILLIVVALPAAAQVEVEGVKMGMSGEIDMGYEGTLSNPGGSSHGLGLGGNGTLQGSYYNPNFLSFSVQPYYNRSQSNAESASVFDTGGYNGNVNLFTGSYFPGSITFNQVWDATGMFGIPGQTGLTTKDSNRNFGIAWSELIPDKPSLTVSYLRGSASSSFSTRPGSWK